MLERKKFKTVNTHCNKLVELQNITGIIDADIVGKSETLLNNNVLDSGQ